MTADQLDLNLLRVLEAVLDEQSITRAAKRLHLSQPAVSHAVARLRRALGDPLVVRRGRGLVLTPEGRRLATEVPVVMDRIRTRIGPTDPELATTTRRFVVAAPDALGGVVGTALRARVTAEAPDASLELRRITLDTEGELVHGSVDAAIAVAGSWTPPLRSTALAIVMWRPVAAATHPLVGRRVDLAELASFPHIEVDDRLVGEAVTSTLATRALRRHLPMVVMSRQVMLENLVGCDLVGFAPSIVPLDDRLAWLDAPDAVVATTYLLWWSAGSDADVLASWVRRQLLGIGEELGGRQSSTSGKRRTIER